MRGTGSRRAFHAQESIPTKSARPLRSGQIPNAIPLWKQQQDKAIKQIAQQTIRREELEVVDNLVNGVTNVLGNSIFRPNHAFNQGNSESVNCLNGELELENGIWVLMPHRRELYRTTQIPVVSEPVAKAPLFLAFLNQVFEQDKDRDEKINAVLEAMGYTLMSHARHELFVILIGPGVIPPESRGLYK